ncbi:disease resistance protein RGA2-like isoform X2 [Zingiber officinale]|uniref:disease resistance protein RGA2-like isoform X2 n=1 Tax=Zingiber officinale TaxID=94328 RepID=UPI001C4ACEBB|nr:disease resistance protein RGA2-like isoform X2 [Zingiber officinale]
MEGAAALAVGGWLAKPVIRMLVDRVSTSSLRGKLHGLQDDDLQKLQRSLLNIHTIVDKAGMRWSRDARLVEMTKQLQDAAYDAEDFLDDLTFHDMKQKIEEEASHMASNRISRAIRNAKAKLFSDSVKRLNKIQKKLDDIYADMEKMCQSLQVDASDVQYQSDLASATRETSSFLISNVLGREEEQKRIIELLLRSTDESASASDKGSSFSVIPLVGIGGVGKTTLAQLVYKDKEIQNHFALKIWICVSENFNVQRLTKEMIESVTKTELSSQMKLDVLQNILKEKIASKMVLLVLDDVWNEEEEEWRKLCAPFMYAAAGSKVIMTTRSKSIADKIGTVEAIVLGDLDEISFWELFKQCAFGSSKPEEHPALVEIGRSIASKLKGLPLAAKTVGNLLGSNMNPDHWRSIMKSEVWELQQNNKNDIIPVLQLSYQYLSAPLKRCFAFCSLFQKDYKFSEIELTRMWMAEGFVVAQGNQRIEDVANETSRMDNGKSNKISTTLRHLAVETEFVETKELRSRFKKLHSLFCQHLKSLPLDFIEKLRSIRVLVLYDCGLQMLPTSVGELVHLRYLDIAYNEMEELPESLCELYNLQTLTASYNSLISLPEDISQLVFLRHLDVENQIVVKIKMIGRLTSLQELSEFQVRKEVGFMITELSGLQQLHGKLKITNLENVESKEEAEKAQMKNKEYLNALELEWGFDHKLDDNKLVAMENVLEGLQPHESLKQLKIRRYCGARSPSWMKKEELSNLERLELSYCESWKDISCTALLPHLKVFHIDQSMWFSKSCFEVCGSRESKLFPMLEELQLRNMNASEELPNLGRFPCLRVIRMTEIKSLKHIDFAASGAIENSLFPMLEELELRGMPALEEISNLGHFPRLKVLHMMRMRLLKHIDFAASCAIENSLFPMLEVLELRDMHALEKLSTLGHFPRLRVLHMIRTWSLKHIVFAASGAIENSLFPMLEELDLRYMPALEEFSSRGHFPRLRVLGMVAMPLLKHIGFASVHATENDLFPALEVLELMDLPVLEELPDLGSLPCLKSFHMRRMSMLKHIDFAFYGATKKVILPKVETLVLDDLEALEELPSNLGRLPCLKVLKIVKISAVKQIAHGFFSTEVISKCFLSLESLWISDLPACERWCWIGGSELFPSLQKLTIYECPKLERLPPLPPSLRYLSLREVGLTELPSLQELETNGSGDNQTTSSLSDLRIIECNNLTSFEEGLLSQNLSNIKDIYVAGCNELMWMPLKRFENFTSLKELQIKACPKLSLTQEEEAALLPPSFKVFILNDCGDLNKLWLGHPYRSTF